jgi:DNA repair photolyase
MTLEEWGKPGPKAYYLQPGLTPEEIMIKVSSEVQFIPPGKTIMISTSCDPFQPIERKYRLMRPILTGLQPSDHVKVILCTKSGLIREYYEEIASVPASTVMLTISCLNDFWRQKWEPNAPPFQERIDALHWFHDLNIPTALSCEPIYPEVSPIPLIHELSNCVDRFIFGKLNYHGNTHDQWYRDIRQQIIDTCEAQGLKYMLKKELRDL